jgi:hypothetical protein
MFPRRQTEGSATRLLLALTACVLAIILAGGWMVQRRIAETKSAAFAIADRVMEAIQVRPKVIVGRKTIVEQQSDVLQLVTTEKTITEHRRIDDSWLHSTKTLEIECDFVVRVGFDLSKPFVVEVNRTTSALRVTMPPAEILAVDLRDVRFPHEEDGLWNKLTPADREEAVRNLRTEVEQRMKKSDLLAQARISAEKRLTDLLATGGRSVTFSNTEK